MYKDWIFFVSPDAHLVSLNAKDGKVRWIVELADVNKGYWATEAPFVVGNHVIVGVGGDMDNLPIFLQAHRSGDGQDAMAMECHSSAGSGRHHRRHDLDGGNLRSRPQPHLLGNRESHAGIGWARAAGRRSVHLQHCGAESRHGQAGVGLSTFAARYPRLGCGRDSGAGGRNVPRTTAQDAHASSRNGYFFVLDRTNGKSLLTVPFGPVNWTRAVDKEGRPIPNPAKEPSPDGRADCAGRGWPDQLPLAQLRP